jgi:predicted nucleic acid-binding protein
MVAYLDGAEIVAINRAATLLDTNVLVAAFSRKERDTPNGEVARFVLAHPDAVDLGPEWLVPTVVLVEAWGLLHSERFKDREGAREMLAWALDTTSRVVVFRYSSDPKRVHELISTYGVDLVDAILFDLALRITNMCTLSPPLPIATADTSDFTILRIREKAYFPIFDMRSQNMV